MEANEARLKRLTQFMNDNTESILKVLQQTDHYRAVAINMDMFKHGSGAKLKLSFSVYDEKAMGGARHHYLYDDDICAAKFKQICERLDPDKTKKKAKTRP